MSKVLERIDCRDRRSLATRAATAIMRDLATAQQEGGLHGDGIVRVVLTGGGTGVAVLEKLAELEIAARTHSAAMEGARIDYTKVLFFFGDERNVPIDHEDSNEKAARQALFDRLGIADNQVISWGFPDDVHAAATRYESLVRRHAPHGFDLHLLGMGGEGHINSLFPHTSATAETQKLAVGVTDSPKPPAQRGTLTLPAVQRADRVWLLVSGEDKADAVARLLEGEPAIELPAAGARGTINTRLFVDEPALSAVHQRG